MKRLIAIAMTLTLSLSLLASCGSTGSTPSTQPSSAPSETASTAPESTAPATGDVKTGLGIVSSLSESTEVTDGKGSEVADITAAAVTVDQDGKIVKCVIDSVRATVEFSDKGELLTPADTVFKSKNELKEDYGVKKASGIGKEWYEQAASFAQYVTGKTVDEVKGIAVNEEGAPSDAELSSSVTVHVGDFISAIDKAVANAQDMGASAGDKLGLSIVSSANQSAAATAESDGVAMVYSYFSVTTFGSDDKITSCVIDAAQNKLTFDTTGKITSDIKAEQKSKNELGDDYGMKKASSIGKEWNEQAASFAQYVTGKTVDEVKGIAVNDEGEATDAELLSSVTIHITDFITLVEKAADSAK